MRLCVIGSGYVGLVTGACLADSGNHVVSVDNDAAKVAQLAAGHCTIFEPGLQELLSANLAAGRLRFTTRLPEGVERAQVIFIAVGTPAREDGSADLSAVENVALQLAKTLRQDAVIVVKSTVPVGSGARLETLIRANTPHAVHLVSNPEFLKEGNAVDDFLRPDRVVIGAENDDAARVVAELYRPFVRNNKPILTMSRAAAEMTKYAANAYLAARISFINEIADMCERARVDVDEVRRGIGADARIGHQFLYPGVGYGGSCFPKDVQALARTARELGCASEILEAVHRRNLAQRARLVDRIRERLGPALNQRRLAVWGLAFKPKTDDVREAPAIAIVQALLEAGASIAVHDPRALDAARAILGERVAFCVDAYDALKGADALIALTEWMEYRSPDFDAIRAALRQPLIFDGRNIYDRSMMARLGFEYYSVGRPSVGAPRG
ncbi:MAG: UDP-glucose/GDP-mannose dehydrogenase family protein [Phycisphaerae bacterium]